MACGKYEAIIDVPLKWILGKHEVLDEPEFYEEEWADDSMKYLGLDPDEVTVEYRLYHENFEVMVFKSKTTDEIVGGYLLIERDEYYVRNAGELDVMVARALIRFGYCKVGY